MWNCVKCGAEVSDEFKFCGWCGTTIDGIEDPEFGSDFAPRQEAEAEEPATVAEATAAVATIAEVLPAPMAEPMAPKVEAISPAPAPAPPVELTPPDWEPENRDSLSQQEYVRLLESKLSCLMDDVETPDWKVNPAFHPAVNAFIQGHATNEAFLKKAQSLQQNRAKYFATIRAQAEKKAAERGVGAPMAEPMPAPMAEAMSDTIAPEPAVNELDFPSAASMLPKAPPPRSWKRRLAIAACIPLLLVGGVLAVSGWARFTGEQQLQEAIAEIEATDPAWQWDHLQEKRAAVTDEANAAPAVEAAAQALPEEWPGEDVVGKDIRALLPVQRLSDEQRAKLKADLERATRSLAAARALARTSTGRWPARSLEEMGTLDLSPGAAQVEKLGPLLEADAILRADEGQFDDALTAVRAMLAAGRTIGDDPDLAAQRVRWRMQSRACAALERILAQGEPSDAAIRMTQGWFEEELSQPLLSRVLRGQRAYLHEMMRRLADGDLSVMRPETQQPVWYSPPEYGLEPIEHWLRYGEIRTSHASALRLMTEAIRLEDQLVAQRPALLKDLTSRATRQLAEDPWLAHSEAQAAVSRLAEAFTQFYRTRAELGCAYAALGAERYRRVIPEWPVSPDDLGVYVTKVPTDPFDGKTLRQRSLKDGCIIYSPGSDGEDGYGSLDGRTPGTLQGKDISFRLWNAERRGQGVVEK